MMATQIVVLTEGYARTIDAGQTRGKFMRATGSCCLVMAGSSYHLFDTMGPWEKDQLIDKLSKLKVHPSDIENVVCSHSHPDHIGNLNLFLEAKKHFVGTSVYRTDLYDLNLFEPTGSYQYKSPKDNSLTEVIQYQSHPLCPNVVLEPTPGHTLECVSAVIDKCEKLGCVALVGDLFENETDLEDEGVWLGAGSQNPDLQRAHRCQIYRRVDHILPGHGPLFKTQTHVVL